MKKTLSFLVLALLPITAQADKETGAKAVAGADQMAERIVEVFRSFNLSSYADKLGQEWNLGASANSGSLSDSERKDSFQLETSERSSQATLRMGGSPKKWSSKRQVTIRTDDSGQTRGWISAKTRLGPEIAAQVNFDTGDLHVKMTQPGSAKHPPRSCLLVLKRANAGWQAREVICKGSREVVNRFTINKKRAIVGEVRYLH